MKRYLYFYIITLFIFVGFLVPNFSFAQEESTLQSEKIEFVLFHSKACPHCKDEIDFINKKLAPKYKDSVDFILYEIGESRNQEIFAQYGYYYNVDIRGVPMSFIDGEVITGFGNEKTTGEKIISIIEEKIAEMNLVAEGIVGEPVDIPEAEIEEGDGGQETDIGFGGVSEDEEQEEDSILNIPVLGDINIKTFSLPVLTIVIGLLDGFNPCAMWVLLFLISLLLGMEDKRRMWLLGSIFIFTSGTVYFFFMAAWLKFLMFIGMILLVRIIVGIVAVSVGGKNIWDFWKNHKAEGVVCKVSSKEGTKNTFEKIKDIVYRRSLWWSIFGILLLGFSVNLVELACSAGFPAIFTQILSMSDLPMWKRYLYMIGYIIFYMIDDMIIFIVAMVTLKSKVFGSKYAKYTNLVAGLMILILGVLLIFKPEWLMFS